MAENNNVVAKLCSDGSVWPIGAALGELANLVNYQIRTEGDIVNKHKLSTTSLPTAAVDFGKQLLLYAKDSDLEGVKTMLGRGAPFTSDWLGMSALHFAAMNNQYDICEVLINGGMNKDIKTKVDRTPLHFATYYGHERIVEMLLSRKCAVNPKDMLRMTPLHWAIERRHKNIVHMLLKHNADVNVVTKFNKTPIGIAVLTEQPDILAELQTAKAEQVNKRFNEEHEREISDAVGAILAEAREQNQTNTNPMDYMEVEYSATNTAAKPQLAKFDQNTAESGALDSNAINLLKSHGISMIKEEDEDASKDLLSTALQNGRQLVLSEGGKMLLNETRQQKLLKSNPTAGITIATQLRSSNNLNNNNKQNQNVAVPKEQQKNLNMDNLQKNNVRIVSYKEFQNMFYNNSDGKPTEKPTPTMSNMRIIRQQNDTAINLTNAVNVKGSLPGSSAIVNSGVRGAFMNARLVQQSQQHRQMKITPMKMGAATTTTTASAKPMSGVQSRQQILKDGKDLSDIIQIVPDDVENDISIIEQKSPPQQQQQQRLTIPVSLSGNSRPISAATPVTSTSNNNTRYSNASNVTSAGVPVCFIPGSGGSVGTRRLDSARATPAVRQVNVIKRPHSHMQQQIKSPATTTNTKANSGSSAKPTPNVMPLLSTPEICRQLYELRKQNEELRRRVDMLQKQKDDMRHRLDRFEELLLVERAEDEIEDIES